MKKYGCQSAAQIPGKVKLQFLYSNFLFFVLILYTPCLCIIQVIHTVYDIVNSNYTQEE